MERTLSRLELLGLASTSNTSSKSAERNDLLVVRDVPKVRVGFGQLKT